MDRVPEPELMTGPDQARAYASADFEDSHGRWLELFSETFGGTDLAGCALDLGCGPGDISFRLAREFPSLTVHGVDGSPAMLECGSVIRQRYPEMGDRVTLLHGMLPDCSLPLDRYQAVVSNSLLHHLPEPGILWQSVHRWAGPGAPVFVMDLMRPESASSAGQLVERYSEGEPEVLRKDFYNSLLAAYRVDEVAAQLKAWDLTWLSVEPVSDRHLVVRGVTPGSG